MTRSLSWLGASPALPPNDGAIFVFGYILFGCAVAAWLARSRA